MRTEGYIILDKGSNQIKLDAWIYATKEHAEQTLRSHEYNSQRHLFEIRKLAIKELKE